MKEMSGRCLLRLTKMSSMLECQESEPQAGQTRIYNFSTNRAIGSLTGSNSGSPDALKGAPDAQHLHPVLQRQPRVTF